MFTDEQITQLNAPLNKSAVKQRSQSGQTLSYIEGWHAIAEANRIFGFGAWSRETLDLRQLGEPYVVEGKTRVNYSARVRVTVGSVVRDGCGFGQGIDRDPGKAHESALKEAETDAMKRALMTFGNPFGLALYDKKQEGVVDDVTPPRTSSAQLKRSGAWDTARSTLAAATSPAQLAKAWAATDTDGWPVPWFGAAFDLLAEKLVDMLQAEHDPIAWARDNSDALSEFPDQVKDVVRAEISRLRNAQADREAA